MNRLLASAAVAAVALVAAPAFAQSSGSPPDAAATPPAKAPAGAPSAAASGADASVTTGMTVKDSTGAQIGTVSGVKADATGKQMATIQMGADTFSVDTSRLAVEDGQATVNATAAQIRQMLKK